MPFRWDPREHAELFRFTLKWTLIALPVAALVGSAVALFLWSLDWATRARWENPWLIWLLPIVGLAIVASYKYLGGESDRGNNLVIDRIHEPGGGVPLRMAPLILVGTVATHLFGGSAGREGTAVQMGGSLASMFRTLFRLDKDDTRILLLMGVAAGFGAVFGTPLAGAIFALEVLAIGRLRTDALIPCFLASVLGDQVCHAWGTGHTEYIISELSMSIKPVPLEALLALKVALAAIIFGLVAFLFAETSHSISALFRRWLPHWWMRPIVGAALVLGITMLLGTRDYLGLGITTADGTGVSIVNAFHEGGAEPLSWFWKLLLTAITIGAGFKGGEVTPLFFVGATLGCVLAGVLNVPVDLLAGIGFVAVFAGATNTPLACTIMAVELFGAPWAGYFGMACFLSYLFSGHSGIYLSQRVARGKLGRREKVAGEHLGHVRDQRRSGE